MYVYLDTYVHMYGSTYMYIYININMNTYKYIYLYIYICMYLLLSAILAKAPQANLDTSTSSLLHNVMRGSNMEPPTIGYIYIYI
jgi:hypothetical protein